jgi:Fic family protein
VPYACLLLPCALGLAPYARFFIALSLVFSHWMKTEILNYLSLTPDPEWLIWFLGCFSRAIKRSEGLLAAVLDKGAFWKMHAQRSLSQRQRKVINRMLDSGRGGFEGGMTTRKYVSLANVSRATAFRELNHLLELGIIKQNPGGGRSVSYDLMWPEPEA